MQPGQGAALLQAGRFQEAIAVYRQWLEREPLSVAPRFGLAQACQGIGDAAQAIAWLSDACRVAPRQPDPLHRLGEALIGQQRFDQALPVYRELHDTLGARDRSTLLHYGFCLEHLGELDAAIGRYRDAVTREPGFLEAHVDLAGVLWRVGDFDGALAHARAAVGLAPEHPHALRILGTALLNLARPDEAAAWLAQALQRQPGFALAELDMAFARLLGGHLADGWSWYRRRWNPAHRLPRPPFFDPAHEWRGPAHQPLPGRRLAVYGEQGLGDVLQFIRYVPLLQAQGAQVCCVLPRELVPLVEHSLEGVPCLGPDRRFEVDQHVALLDLPAHLGTTLETVPAAAPYLRAPAPAVRTWRQRLRPWDEQLKVGLAWSGSPRHVNDRNRSLPLSAFDALLALDGVQCFSLQKSGGGVFHDRVPPEGTLVDFTSQWQDFADSAAQIEALDLVVTVDTAVAHLAGALGKPTWLLLPPNPDWRWLLGREDSPWYPTMRLFRRGFGEGIDAPVQRVVEAVRSRTVPATVARA